MKKILLLLINLFLISSLSAKGKMRTAILNLKPTGVSKVEAEAVTNFLISNLINYGKLTIIERSQIKDILKEQNFHKTRCTETVCAVKVGKLLSVRKIVIGEVTRLGKAIYVTIRIIDVEKGIAEHSSEVKTDSFATIDKAVKKLSMNLIKKITGDKNNSVNKRKTITGYYLRGLFPGWGQFYAGNYIKGFAYSGTFITTAGFMSFSISYFMKLDKEYDDLPDGTSNSKFKDKHNEAQLWGYISIASICAVSAVYIINWIDLLFFTELNIKTSNLFNPEKEVYFSFAFTPSQVEFLPGDTGLSLSINIKF
ncbi:CsgG/HfaB family protein [Spirochaetota bacterium]